MYIMYVMCVSTLDSRYIILIDLKKKLVIKTEQTNVCTTFTLLLLQILLLDTVVYL